MADNTLVLKATVVKGRNLAPKDKNGFSDPFLVVSLSEYRFQTQVVPKTLDPIWNNSFEMPLSGVNNPTLVCVCWDKDLIGKDYMGEIEVSLDEYFANGQVSQEPRWFPLKSSRKKATISGEIQLHLSLYDSTNENATQEQISQKWQAWLSFFATVTSPAPSGDDEDPLSREDSPSDDEDDESPGPDDMGSIRSGRTLKKGEKKKKGKDKKSQPYELYGGSDVVGVIFLEVSRITDLPPERNMTRTGFDMDPFVVVSLGKKTYRTRHIRHQLNPVYDEKMVFQVLRHEQNYSLNFAVVDRDKLSSNDFVAQTNFPLQEVIATQPLADPDTGLYNLREPLREEREESPITPGGNNGNKSRFRIPLSRSASGTSLASRKGDRAEIVHKTSTLSLRNASTLPHNTEDTTTPVTTSKALPFSGDFVDYELKPFELPLPLKNKDRWEDKHNPQLYIKAKYVPYPALRQQFWRYMLRQYDADDSGMMSRVELSTMLDTLGSTLSNNTIDSFFERFQEENGAENLETMELTMDQAVICLEDQLTAVSKKSSAGLLNPRTPITPQTPLLPRLTFPSSRSLLDDNYGDDTSTRSIDSSTESDTPPAIRRTNSMLSLTPSMTPSLQTHAILGSAGEEYQMLEENDLMDSDGNGKEEHVIQIRECPLCHQPRLNKRSEVDIVTHLATCASQDWRQVDKLVMGGFVSSSQAQRKWYSKVITKISYGGYKLGANSANILVQDRITGQIQEERMSVYVRLGIRLLYKGLTSSSMENKKIKKLLHSLSVKQGKKFDNPASARDIKGFIAFHQLDLSEVLLPLEEFKTFNQFFYRALKPGARPCTAPDNPKVVVSPADCRTVVFNDVEDAVKIWIKGREFTIARLLGNAYPEDVKRFENGALGIFRLAPQDYHRFHIPVDGVLGKPKEIKGEYYTVNPMAIRSALDVYGENIRICVPVDSDEFGRVMIVCVGAMMVGSTVITAKEGQRVKRTDELGYFQFGGSTIVLLFEPGRMRFDDDLVHNSKAALETLIRVGMSIGHTPDTPGIFERKQNVTQEDKLDARRRIEGSLAPPANLWGIRKDKNGPIRK
ncbi:phosphatidylserine decarboxylase [Rhizina undulata]